MVAKSVDPSNPGVAVLYEVKPEFQDAFFKFTSKNIGMPLAIIIDGEYYSAPVIHEGLRDNIQITSGSHKGEFATTREFAASLATGKLAAPIKLLRTEKQ